MSISESSAMVDYRSLLRFAIECFREAGFEDDKAKQIGESLIEADLRGVNTHGVIRIPMYISRVRAGLIDPKAEPQIVVENDSMAVLDAGNGMGQIASNLAMNMAIEKAQFSTIAIVGVRNSNHFGTAAYYTMKAVEQQMIGICCSNTEPLMPAPGGAKAVVGNNPMSVAIPAQNRPPIVFDMAASAAAIGKIVLAKKKNELIPTGWAVDKEGMDTTDPNEAFEAGLLLPVGGPKGYGLAIIVDALAGILTRSGFGKYVYSPFTDMDNAQRVGHMFMALNIASFQKVEEYLTQVDEYVNDIKSSSKAKGVDEIYLPGEIEFHTKQTRLMKGIPLPQQLIEELHSLASEWGVKERINI